MWTPLRKEIERIRMDFALTDQIAPAGLSEWKRIQDLVYEKFYKVRTPRYKSWDDLKVQSDAFHPDQHPYLLLDKLIDPDTGLFLLLNETVNEREKYWIYEATVAPIQTIVGESIWVDEVIIVDKKFEWILSINHHEMIIAGGEKMVERLKKIKLNMISK